MAHLKFTTVSLKVPTFLFSPWSAVLWGPLVLASCFSLGIRLIPQRAAAREAKPAPAAAASWPFAGPNPELRDDQGYPLLNGLETMLPCGHLAIGMMAGGGPTVYSCSHGHSFHPYGNWFVPTGR